MCVGGVGNAGDIEGTGTAFPNFANSATVLTLIIKEGQSNLGKYIWQSIQKMFAECHTLD